jgi:DNA adenine methylase
MKYLGGKHRLGKEISGILKHVCPKSHTNYLEPFCGALGVFRHMTDDFKCLGSDLQADMIQLWKGVKNNTFKPPKNITPAFYNKVKNQKGPSALRGFVGFLCSWNGMFFAGLAEYKNTNRNPAKEASNDIDKIKPSLRKKNVKFMNCSYDKHKPKKTLIYCDPPYKDTIGYKGTGTSFNHDKFWNTMRKWSKSNIVIISEETSPKDFKCMWKKKYSRGRGFKKGNDGKDVEEKLFIHKSNYDKLYDKIKSLKRLNKVKTKRK